MLFHPPSLPDLDAVEAVARAGAAALLPHFRRLAPGEVSEKACNDLVTVADRAAEQAIIAAVRDRFPDHSVLSEEAGEVGGGDGPKWVVDPLDGTANFVHGFPHFAVSVAVATADRVELAVVLDPLRDDCFRAARGHGATWNGRPCRVSDRERLDGALLTTGFPFRSHEHIDAYLAIFKAVFLRCHGVRRPGSAALDLAHVACGIFDGFFEFSLAAWDVAAGALLVEEAGGLVTDMSGEPRPLGAGDVLAGPPGVHRELLRLVRSRLELAPTA
jgi:myo-inositol-1(or 4)-monophosphatase